VTQVEACMTPELTEREFQAFRRLIHERSGIHLSDNKLALVRARLAKRLRALGVTSFGEYYEIVTARGPAAAESMQMIDAISTNLTKFFREPEHFDYLGRHVFNRFESAGVIRILCAGCSTGEEPYTIAMTALEHLGSAAQSRVRITALDISTAVLARAAEGIYTTERLEALPADVIQKYFVRGLAGNAGLYRVKNTLKAMIEFSRANLTEPLKLRHSFHVIFCRNVAIYFDRATQRKLAEQFRALLVPGGTLFVGHSESLLSAGRQFKYVQPAVYERGD
jgi:chemotaxis protein methyltransferase CheR